MPFTVEELRPANPILVIDRDIPISLITLHIDSKFSASFGKLENVYSEIRRDPMRIFEAIWILILDKSEWKNSTAFKHYCLSQNQTSEVTARMMGALQESIALSMPIIKNRERYNELMKINNSQESRKPCYGVYYDTLAKRYGYTIDQFYELTLRQLHILLHIVGDQSYEEIEIQAALQGKKLKPRMKPLEFDEKEDKAMDEDAKEIHARLMKEYKEKQGANK